MNAPSVLKRLPNQLSMLTMLLQIVDDAGNDKNEGLIMNACWAEVGRPREGSGGRLGPGERGW